jgi:hypothetical protein
MTFESKHVAVSIIGIYIVLCWLNFVIKGLRINTTGWLHQNCTVSCISIQTVDKVRTEYLNDLFCWKFERQMLKWTGSCTSQWQFWFFQFVIRHHHHQYRACRVLCLVTCSSPMNSPKVLGARPWLPFPHGRYFTIKCGSLSVCLSLSIRRTCCIFLFL